MTVTDYLTPINLFIGTVALANGLAGSFFYFVWRSLKKSVQADILKKVDEHKATLLKDIEEKSKVIIEKVETVVHHMKETEDEVRDRLEKSDKEVAETLAEQDKQGAIVLEKLDTICKGQSTMQEGVTKTAATIETLNKGLTDHIVESTKDRADLRSKIEINSSVLESIKSLQSAIKKRSSRNKANKIRRS